MRIKVTFYSYFRELAGTETVSLDCTESCLLGELVTQVQDRFPKLKSMDRSTLIAVGLEYQDRSYSLQPGDEVSLFPPVQGG
tara:strand:- start:1183 stop:1428 length:246 start_codon:yes stop_codon:yes gene_type:complete